MKAPSIPKTLVNLGRAVELDCDTWNWTWNKRDNYIVCCNVQGSRLFIFPAPSRDRSKREKMSNTKGKRLFKLFNRADPIDSLRGRVVDRIKKTGQGLHIVYNSDKFGKKENYIHEFDSSPTVWVDNPKKPRMIATTGGRIRITARGIEG